MTNSALGRICADGLFGLLELHRCSGVLAAGVFEPKSDNVLI